ncbi:hypothetical protein [Garicola koreensis]|uniref:Uncharacterized protein n=1 Tax=Garicola koreensis TaxID=1262554 RepID=A0A7W5TSR2_9MICC|nr:hypothetical protein [Garicola koreensis]MBB3668470.1 hypothetical protein [Garicola koreensis]
MSQMDPWSTGTPGYRTALLTGMGSTLLGILVVIAAAFVGSAETASTLGTLGLVLLGIGAVSHVVGIGLRKRQAAQIIRERKSTG